MIFSELYGAYYNTLARILALAVRQPLEKDTLREIIRQQAFGESVMNIEPALEEERWQLLRSDGSTPLRHTPTIPLTLLEKRWLKAIAADPRIRLFTDELPDFPGLEPLFRTEDISLFDKYADGDPYEDETYIKNFRLILEAIKKRCPLSIDSLNRRGGITHVVFMPEYLEYSEKDDKFRLIGSGCRYGGTVNLSRIVRCKPYTKPFEGASRVNNKKSRTAELELYDRRNAMERVLIHFADFEKQVERIAEDRYKITLSYDEDDETELLIRVLSFGPMLKETAPRHFVELIKERLLRQKSCGH